MLKPDEIRSHSFISNTDGSYQKQDIDNFFAEICASYDQMFQENGELVKKISLLADRVSQYRNDEDNIRRALLAAERMSAQIRKDAEEEASQKRAEADKTYTELISTAQNNAHIVETKARVEAEQLTEESKRSAQERVTSAERTASSMISEAEQKAANIVENAKHFAQQELDRINHEIKVNTVTLEALGEEVASFKQALLDSYRKHIEYITTLPREEDFKQPKAEPAVIPDAANEDEVAKAADEFVTNDEKENDDEKEASPVEKAQFDHIVDTFTQDEETEEAESSADDESAQFEETTNETDDEGDEEISLDFNAIADDIESDNDSNSEISNERKRPHFFNF